MIRIEPPNADLFRLHYAHRAQLPMWTLFNKPTDYPDSVVARMFVTHPRVAPTTIAVIGDSLDEVRGQLPQGLYRLPRHAGDEPQIVETWI